MRQAAIQNNEGVMKTILKRLVQGYSPQPPCSVAIHTRV